MDKQEAYQEIRHSLREWERALGDVDEEENEEDEEDGEDEEDEEDEEEDESEPPRVWPGARYYCAQEDCNFTDGDWAGTRRAWWNQYKARIHANSTGHTIERVRG